MCANMEIYCRIKATLIIAMLAGAEVRQIQQDVRFKPSPSLLPSAAESPGELNSELEARMTAPSFQEWRSIPAEPIVTMMATQQLQKQLQDVAEQMETEQAVVMSFVKLAASPKIQEHTDLVAEKIRLRKFDQHPQVFANWSVEQTKAILLNSTEHEQAEHNIGQPTDLNLQKFAQLYASLMKFMKANPNFQEHAKIVAKQMEAMIDEPNLAGKADETRPLSESRLRLSSATGPADVQDSTLGMPASISEDVAWSSLDMPINFLIDSLVDALFDLTLKGAPSQRARLENTTIGKSGDALVESTHDEERRVACLEEGRSDNGGKPSGNISFPGAVLILASTTIGSGTLTMPFVYAKCGWMLAILISVVVILLTTFSTYLLVAASDKQDGDGARSFESLGYWSCGLFGSIYAETTFIFGGIGTLTASMIFLGKLMAQVLRIGMDRSYLPLISTMILVIVPLTWPRKINALRFASLGALISIFYVVAMFIAFSIGVRQYDDDLSAQYVYDPARAVVWTAQSINSVNLILGAYCMQNTCLPTYGELAGRSPKKMIGATLCAMAVSFFVYALIGVCGYVMLGGNVKPNALLNFDHNFIAAHPWTLVPSIVAKISISLVLAKTVPLAIWPCRSAICSVILHARAGWAGLARRTDAVPDTMFRMVTLGILATITTLAIILPDVTIPLGVVNSLAGGSMIFVMPGLFYLGATKERAQGHSIVRWGAYSMVCIGALVCILGFSLHILSIIDRYK